MTYDILMSQLFDYCKKLLEKIEFLRNLNRDTNLTIIT